MKMVKKIDPVKKSEFEKQFIILNFLFTIINTYSVIFLIRLYLPAVHGTCNVVDSGSVLNMFCFAQKKELPSIDCEKEIKKHSDSFYHNQRISIGCMSEIINYFGSYIIITLLIGIIRFLINKVKSKRLLIKNKKRKEKFKTFYHKKLLKLNKLFKFLKTQNEFLATSKTLDKNQKVNSNNMQTSINDFTNFQTNDEESKKLLLSNNIESFQNMSSNVLYSENATEVNEPNKNPIENYKSNNIMANSLKKKSNQ